MARERIRFGVDLDRKTDGDFQEIARVEQRSKRNMHAVLVQRIVRLWKDNPGALRQLGLIQQ
jgi:hypothetical protein